MCENNHAEVESMGMTNEQSKRFEELIRETELAEKNELRREIKWLRGCVSETEMSAKILLTSVSDILATSQDLTEATARFKRIMDAAGVSLAAPSPNTNATVQNGQRFSALDANVVIDGDTVTVTADDGIVIPLSLEEWEVLRVKFGIDHMVDYKSGETPASGYVFRACVDVFRKHQSLEAENEHLIAEKERLLAELKEKP